MKSSVISYQLRAVRLRARTWVVLGLFAALAAGLMWPVVAHLSTRVPGTATWAFDEYTFLWNDWYLRHALLDLHASPLHTNLIWYPLGIDLVLYTFNFTNASLALPLQLAANVVLASNATLLLATALSGFGAYLLALYVLASARPAMRGRSVPGAMHLAALLAGIIYAAGSNRAVYLALGHYNFATSQWLPFYALYLLKTLAAPRARGSRPAPGARSWIGIFLRSEGAHNALMAGLFFALAAWTEMTFASFLALLSLVVVLACRRLPGMVERPQAGRRGAALRRLALAGVIALLLWSPMLVPTAREFLRSDYGTSGWGDSLSLSADLLGMVTPTDLNPLLAPDPAPVAAVDAAPTGGQEATARQQNWQAELRAVVEGKGRFRDINTVFLGYLTLALALLGAGTAFFRRQAGASTGAWARPWVWSALVFGILSLGPLLQVAGRYQFSLDNLLPGGVTLPLPFALLHYVPFINANRAPNRFSLLLMLALAMLAAGGAAWVMRAVARSHKPVMFGLAGLLAAGIVLEHLAAPLPTTDAQPPAIYAQIAEEPGEFSILQLPLGWRNSYETLGSEDTRLQYYQTIHGKAIIGGNISRAPAIKMDYFRRIPLFQALTDLELYKEVPPEIDAAARSEAGALAALYDIRYLITFPPVPGRYPYQDTWQRVQDYALKTLPVDPIPFWQEDGVKAYRIRQPVVPFPFRLDLGTAGNEPYLGQGWDANLTEQPYNATATWIDGKSADVYLPLSGPVDSTLRLAVAPLAYPGAAAQSLSVRVNGMTVLDRQALAEGWQTLSAPVPASVTRRGPNQIRLEFAWAASPRRAFPDAASRAVIGSTGVPSPANVDVRAFSEAFIQATGPDGQATDASTGRRGYNVAVIDPASGKVLDRQGFDTAANAYEADRLAAYLRGIRSGQIVAVATKGDATAYLTPGAVDALRGIGSRAATPAGLAGQAQALIGVQGAAPGTAAEVIAKGEAFVRVAGDFRTLSAAVDWVELGK